ncbi:trans-sialidase, putative [Trypanosoma cruzi]|uniref:Trans-sialidase, putative n=1 Tax=Trypanosoma cruzi (strain CL Brener) TaxID=353153 RepID=Q4DIN5_TRYCC|nr:trans-sialidase, putative [Trypanosoma cruzi]EAN92395.1 trans-sialidase, putative [Trypanosoma cruzi]|eukprot:XP_814246.1 trans-sialidase [Trypanosoma cruzi strain CL Brener]
MSRHLFNSAVLLLLLMVCSGSGAASAEASNSRNGIIFKGGDSFNDPETENLVQSFHSFRAPSLVYVSGVVVATVEAHYKNTTDKKSCVSLVAKSMKSNGGEWTKGTAIVFDHYDVKIDRLLSPTTFVDEEDGYEINALVGGYGTSTTPLTEVTGDGYWAPRMAGGLIPHDDDDEEKKEFRWQSQSTSKVPYDIWGDYSTKPKRFKQILGGGGAGIRMEDESRYVLPIQALKDDGKVVSLVILAKGFTYGWEFSNGTSDEGCIQPAVLEWEGKDLVMMTSCEDGSRRVYRADEEGRRWTEEYDTLSRVWGNSLNRIGHGVQGGFVSATIDEQKVILVSRPVYSGEEGKQETGRLHLWLTDMQRIYDVGPISAENENVAASTLLYATVELPSLEEGESKEEKKLYCSYEVAAEDGKYNIAFVDLTEKLEDMRKVLAAWKTKDAQIAKEYGCGNEKDANKRRDCDDLTKGLVGLLSNTSTDSTWADEYLCVNATVHGKVESTPDGGLTFKGPGAWAEWPVGDMGQTVPYHFANSKFTLVATVSIDKAPKEGSSPIPLMGVRMNDAQGTVLLGLSYTHDKKWMVTFNGSHLTLPAHDDDVEWEANKKYHVVLQMDYNNGLFVYVDGKRICDTEDYEVEDYEGYKSFYDRSQELLSSNSISHFYIGSENEEGSESSYVTVSNVLLYNRLLHEDELSPLMKTKAAAAPEAEVPAPEGAPQNSHLSQPSEKDATPSPQKQDLSPEKSENEKHSAGSQQASSTDPAGSSTSAAEGKVEEVASSSVGSASSFSPTAGEDSPQKVREADVPATEDHFEREQVHSSLSVVQPMTEQAEEAAVATPQRKTTEDWPQHSTLSDASEDVEKSSFHPAPLTSDEQTVDPEERKDTNPHTAVGASSGPDSSHSTEVAPMDGATAAHEPSTDPKTAQGHDEVLDGDDAAPGNKSTLPGETKIPSGSNATSLLEHEVLLEHGHLSEVAAMALTGDSTVHGCVSRVLLLLLLGLWGTAALC